MRILFIGCVESSYKQLKLLLDYGKSIVGVITKQESSFNTDFCDISSLCIRAGIPFRYADNINSCESETFIRNCKPDIAYCFGWSQLIGETILNIPPLGIIGNHPAELPKNRGRHPIIWALALGLEKTASTFFHMNTGADTGDIISQELIPITYEDNARTLYDKVTESEIRQILQFTEALETGKNIKSKKQNDNEGNTWRKRSVQDGLIDWRMSTRAIYNLVRALSEPYPGATFMYRDKSIRIWRCKELDGVGYENIEPGKVIAVKSKTDYVIKAYDGLIHVLDSDNFEGKQGEYL